MADTQRTRAALLTILADNDTGQISEQDVRDLTVTIMEEEFVNPGDFFALPKPRYLTTDRTTKGAKDYSQIMLSDCSFGTILCLTPSGTWRPADATDSTLNPGLGLACASYLAAESQATILRRGMVFLSNWSGLLSGNIGRVVYLHSGTAGSIAVTYPTAYRQRLGIVEPADIGSTGTLGKWRFDPSWKVAGV